MAHASSVLGVDLERVLIAIEVHLLPLGVDFMFAVSTIPLGDGRVLVHVLDDLAPADAGVVRAEGDYRSEEHTSELQSLTNLVCRLLLEKKKKKKIQIYKSHIKN